LQAFLQQNNPQALRTFPEIIDLYLQEASIEGVNPDIAFTQALLETDFFRFGRSVQPTQNNFAALREVGAPEPATFPNVRIGVRAHIQMLKTYASVEPFAQDSVTPRFRFIARGVAPQIEQLGAFYSADPLYSRKIIATLKQLYQYQFDRLS
ncbi:glucosaminidase domain-containing protein, partial [Pseudanabaenaceae cyanobacterium LEGE 13415]|nr:glucosaminidase domain-containing protein [Pseudanabaenaceae cyanobacterium LEGE 13415]